MINAYMMRVCLNVAITEMTVKKDHQGTGTFEWDEELQGIILGAFFWGYVSFRNT